MGWLIALGIITLMAILPLGVSIRYDADGLVVKLIIGPVKVTLYPRTQNVKKKKDHKQGTEQQPIEPAPPAQTNSTAQTESVQVKEDSPAKPSGGPITDFLPLLRIVLDMLGTFRRRLRLDVLELKLVMAADDPCDLAVNYGRAWAAVGNLMPRLERLFVIKKRNIEVQCDFETTQTLAVARLDLTITLGRLLATVVVYGVKALVEFLKIKNKRKGGASK